MANTTITPTALVYSTASADLPVTAGTAIVAANTFLVPYPVEGKLLIVINNTTAGAKNITIKAGDSEFIESVKGDYVIAFAQDDVRFLVPESSRFKNADGTVHITFESSTTGFVQAFSLP